MLRDLRDEGLTKQEIKEKLIIDALKELFEGDRLLIRSTSVLGVIHTRLHEENAFDNENYVMNTIPETSDIKQYLSNNHDVGFVKVSDFNDPGTWILLHPNTTTDQCSNCDDEIRSQPLFPRKDVEMGDTGAEFVDSPNGPFCDEQCMEKSDVQ